MKHATIFSLLIAVVLFLPTPARAQAEADIEGRWEGTLEASDGAELRLVVHLERAEDGTIEARLDHLDQTPALDIPLEATFENGVLILVVPELAAGFGGTFTGPDRIEGLWEQAGTRTPLELRRSEEM